MEDLQFWVKMVAIISVAINVIVITFFLRAFRDVMRERERLMKKLNEFIPEVVGLRKKGVRHDGG